MKRILHLFLIPTLVLAHFSITDIVNTEKSEFTERQEECGFIKAMIDFQNGIERPRPPSGPKYIYKPHFIIHFDTTGTHATTRAYAESTGVYAETVWTRLSNLGWYMPPPDGSMGGDSRYDIYIRSIGYLGVCYPENAYTTPFPDGYSSWVEIYKSGITFARLSALVTHEFGHGCQIRYSKFEEPLWAFYENTSVFLEDIVFDDVNTLPDRLISSTDNPLDRPHYPITRATGVYEYRGALWTHFLDEYYDTYPARAVRRIWEICGMHAGSYLLYDMDSTLRIYYDSDLFKALGHYAIWRYYCGTRDDGQHYEEGLTYIDAAILRSHSTYPASGNQGTSNPSGPGGCNFVRFTSLGDNQVTLYFDGQNGYTWAAYVLGNWGNWSMEYKIQLEPGEDTGSITIPGWEFTEIVLVPVVIQWTGSPNNLTYSYSVTRTPHFGIPADGITGKKERILFPMLHIQPNPFKSQTTIHYSLPATNNTLLEIYNASGCLITNHQLLTTNNYFVWDGKDMNGREVENGIYFCCLKNNNQIINKKITVLR